jgi:uncharacterized protein YqeY
MSDTIKAQLESDLKEAMRSGDTTARETIRYTLAALKNAEIEKRSPLTPEEELEILKKQAKSRADSIDQFKAAGRQDLVERETNQLAVLKKYMPAELSDDDLIVLIERVAAELEQPVTMAKIMPAALKAVGDGASGRRVNEAVRTVLARLA